MNDQNMVELGKNKPVAFSDYLYKYAPGIYKSFLFIKWSLRHRISFLNTKLTKQIRRIAPEVQSKVIANFIRNDSKRVLFFAMRQDPPHLAWNSVLAMALMLRGHSVQNIACNGLIRRACNSGNYPNVKRWTCSLCKLYARRVYNVSPIPTNWLDQFVGTKGWEKAEAIIRDIDAKNYEEFSYAGLPIGRLAESSTVHFLREGVIKLDSESRQVYRDFIIGGIFMVDICKMILDQYSPDVVVMLNGWFISERIMLEIARQRNIRVITYENGFRDNTIYFCENEPIKYEIDNLWSRYRSVPLNAGQEKTLSRYLGLREAGNLGWVKYKLAPQDIQSVKKALKLDLEKKIVIAFSSISWDSTLWRLDVGFANMLDWLKNTIYYFLTKSNVQLLIRLHPGEIVSGVASRDSIVNKLQEMFPSLPPNIKIINPTSNISSYTLMKMSDIGLVYTSTTGLEMAIKGKPVIIAGNPHYKRKGFTYDADSCNEYTELLDHLLNNAESTDIKQQRIELARRYAYRLFFDGCIPFNLVEEGKVGNIDTRAKLNFTSVEELFPGRNRYLDRICDAIINGGNL